MDMETALRDAAREENAALPFGTWKEALLAKAEQQEPGEQDLPLRDADLPEEFGMNRQEGLVNSDELRLRRHKSMRRVVRTAASLAAALLVLVGVRAAYLNTSGSSTPMNEAESLRDNAAPAAEAPMPRAYGAPFDDDSIEESLQSAPREEVAMDVQEAAGGIAATDMPYAGGGGDSGNMLPNTEQDVLQAVRNALMNGNTESRGAESESDVPTEFVSVEYKAGQSYSLIHLDGAGPLIQLEKADVYIVVLDTRVKNADQYVVDAATLEVLGILSR